VPKQEKYMIMGPFMLLWWLVGLVLALAVFLFWLWMLIDCLTSSRAGVEKLIWVLVIIFLYFLGALIYFFLGRTRTA
jgi:hypothetical protein